MNLSKSKEQLNLHRNTLGDELVDFFIGLWDLMEGIEPAAWTPSDIEALNAAAKNGTVMFSVESPVVTASYVTSTLRPILTYIGSKFATFEAVVQAADKADIEGDLTEELLAGAFTAPDDLIMAIAELLGVDNDGANYDFLRLAVVTALSPPASAAAAQLTTPEAGSFKTGICPCCGMPATFAHLKQAGELSGDPRDLWCSFCDTSWAYPRLQCVRCGHNVQKDLPFYFDETNQGYRIYACKKCGGTIKGASESTLHKLIDPRATDIMMTKLEAAVIAQSETLMGQTLESDFAE